MRISCQYLLLWDHAWAMGALFHTLYLTRIAWPMARGEGRRGHSALLVRIPSVKKRLIEGTRENISGTENEWNLRGRDFPYCVMLANLGVDVQLWNLIIRNLIQIFKWICTNISFSVWWEEGRPAPYDVLSRYPPLKRRHSLLMRLSPCHSAVHPIVLKACGNVKILKIADFACKAKHFPVTC